MLVLVYLCYWDKLYRSQLLVRSAGGAREPLNYAPPVLRFSCTQHRPCQLPRWIHTPPAGAAVQTPLQLPPQPLTTRITTTPTGSPALPALA
uniref:Uncharacterized protein n=1 Tax=Knipowitschia caucasica TaxID=637954 RepID=A0AAV2M3N8_KNICA